MKEAINPTYSVPHDDGLMPIHPILGIAGYLQRLAQLPQIQIHRLRRKYGYPLHDDVYGGRWSLSAQFVERCTTVVAIVRLVDPAEEETTVPFVVHTGDVVRVVEKTILFPSQICQWWICTKMTVKYCLFSVR